MIAERLLNRGNWETKETMGKWEEGGRERRGLHQGRNERTPPLFAPLFSTMLGGSSSSSSSPRCHSIESPLLWSVIVTERHKLEHTHIIECNANEIFDNKLGSFSERRARPELHFYMRKVQSDSLERSDDLNLLRPLWGHHLSNIIILLIPTKERMRERALGRTFFILNDSGPNLFVV